MSVLERRKIPVITIRCPTDWFEFYIMGDFHIGHCQVRYDKLVEQVRWFRSQPNYGIFLMGDMTENVIPGSKGDTFDLDIPDPQKQIAKAVEIMAPIKDHLLSSVEGNHSARSERASSFSPDQEISRQLGCNFLGCSGYVYINLIKTRHQPITYIFWLEHGSSNAPTLGGKVNCLIKMSNLRVADGYFCGHIHQKLAFPLYRDRIVNGKEISEKFMVASCGSYLDEPKYALRAGYRFAGLGVTKLQICATRKDIHANV